jgi:hypothetical protein
MRIVGSAAWHRWDIDRDDRSTGSILGGRDQLVVCSMESLRLFDGMLSSIATWGRYERLAFSWYMVGIERWIQMPMSTDLYYRTSSESVMERLRC